MRVSDPWCKVLDMPHDPWLHIEGMDVTVVHEDCEGLAGSWCGQTRTIRLHPGLNQRQRRSVLAHETVHCELGHEGRQSPAVEMTVRKIAARRLIGIKELSRALLWCDHIADLADELVCRPIDVRVRLEHLHPSERGYLRARWLEREHTA